jgi:hypothetical protein
MSYFDAKTSGDTYNYGVKVLAYTAQFGNGFSATIARHLLSDEPKPNRVDQRLERQRGL